MKKLIEDFKKFITKGNVVDMAVAVIIGAAFNKIVSSLVADIITPLISLFIGKVDFTELKIILREATETMPELTLNYGVFIQYIFDFLIIALTVFVMVKVFTKLKESADYNLQMTKIVQKKLDADEELNKIEKKWLKRYNKAYPDLAPKKKEQGEQETQEVVEEVKEEPLTKTEQLLTDILQEMKKNTNTNEEIDVK